VRRTSVAVALGASMISLMAGAAPVHASGPRWCRNVFVGPSEEDKVDSIRAYGPSCSTATSVATASRKAGAPFDVRLNYIAYRFRCHGQFKTPPGGGEGWIQFRCSRGPALILFIHR
jgi:hypothetical protein